MTIGQSSGYEQQHEQTGDDIPKSAEELTALEKAKQLAEATKDEFYACQGKFTTSDKRTIPYTVVKDFTSEERNDDSTYQELLERGHLG